MHIIYSHTHFIEVRMKRNVFYRSVIYFFQKQDYKETMLSFKNVVMKHETVL